MGVKCKREDENTFIVQKNCKKLKMEYESGDDSQFDPFNLGDEKPYESILQYLNGEDILNLSLTSKFLYAYTCESPTAMKKIKFVVNERHGAENLSKDLVERSSRQYQHLEIKGIFDSTDCIVAFVEKNSHSLVSVKTGYDLSMGDYISLPLLESLTLFSIDLNRTINLYADGFISNASSLRELKLLGKVNKPELIVTCMRVNVGLKKLSFDHNSIDDLYCKAAHNYDFKLEIFACDATSHDNDVFWANIVNFLDYQSDSLRDLKINCSYRTLTRIFYLLPKLRAFTFNPIPTWHLAGSVMDFDFRGHGGIEEARFIFTPPAIIARFVRNTPKLRTIYVADLSIEIFKILVEGAPKLRCLKFAYISIDDNHHDTKVIIESMINYHQNHYEHEKPPLTIIQI